MNISKQNTPQKSLCNYLKALITATISFVLFCILAKFEFVYSSSDDYIISFLLSEGDDYSVFLNIFLSKPLVLLYRLLPYVNWFILFQQILSALALFVIDYIVFCVSSKNLLAYSLVLSVNAIVCSTNIFVLQWTQTSTFICSVAVVLLLFALFIEKRKKHGILQIIFSTALLLLGSLIRFEAFEMCALILCIVAFLCYTEMIYMNKLSTHKLSFCFRVLSKKLLSIILVICLFFSGFIVHLFSEKIKESTNNYSYSYSYNSARARVNDYDVADYLNNEAFYNSIGVKSPADLDLVKYHFIDEDFFDIERLNSIADYSFSLRSEGESGLYFAIDRNIKLIRDEISKLRSFLPFRMGKITFVAIFVLLLFLIVFILVIILFCIRKKNKNQFKRIMNILLPLLLLLLWGIFFAIYKVDESNYLMVFLCMISVSATFIFNRYYYIKCTALNIICMALYCYQKWFRMSFRVNFVIVFPIMLFLIFFCQDKYLRNENKRKIALLKYILFSFVIIFASILIGMNCWIQYYIPQNRVVASDSVINYIKKNPDIDFVYSAMCYPVLDNTYSKFPNITPKLYPNTIYYGDWFIGTNAYKERINDNDIDCLFKDMINNNRRQFIFVDTDEYDSIKLHEQFYNDHYATKGKRIRLVKEKQFACKASGWDGESSEIQVATYTVIES